MKYGASPHKQHGNKGRVHRPTRKMAKGGGKALHEGKANMADIIKSVAEKKKK